MVGTIIVSQNQTLNGFFFFFLEEYTSYYDIPAVQCNQCHKQFAKQEPIQKLSKINHFFKTIFKTSCIRMKRHKKTIEKCCCKEKEFAVNSKSSESITFVDLPWIVPSEYHKNITGKNAEPKSVFFL